MFQIAICDDNCEFADALESRLRKLCEEPLPEGIEITVIPAFYSAEDVAEYLCYKPIDLLLLDIDLPGMSGFDLAGILRREQADLLIVFVSAYDQFVFDSFDFRPFAYLRKDRIEADLSRLWTRLTDRLYGASRVILFPTIDGTASVESDAIVYLESRQNYYWVHCQGAVTYCCRGTLSSAEKLVQGLDFYRIHSGYLINFHQLDRVVSSKSVLMKDGTTLRIAAQRSMSFRTAYMRFSRKGKINP